jgi:hypothetical protein
MAQKVQVQLIDDLDGESVADETVRFALDGRDYEIDLSRYHAEALRENLADYINAARKTGRKAKAETTAGNGQRNDRGLVRKVRDWARANGHQISDRGRIPADVWNAYQQKD